MFTAAYNRTLGDDSECLEMSTNTAMCQNVVVYSVSVVVPGTGHLFEVSACRVSTRGRSETRQAGRSRVVSSWGGGRGASGRALVPGEEARHREGRAESARRKGWAESAHRKDARLARVGDARLPSLRTRRSPPPPPRCRSLARSFTASFRLFVRSPAAAFVRSFVRSFVRAAEVISEHLDGELRGPFEGWPALSCPAANEVRQTVVQMRAQWQSAGGSMTGGGAGTYNLRSTPPLPDLMIVKVRPSPPIDRSIDRRRRR